MKVLCSEWQRLKDRSKTSKNKKTTDNHRSRSPTPARREHSGERGGPRGSSQPSSPRDDRDPDEELELVFGGWNEGRRQDVEHEVNQIFQKTNMQDRLHAVIVPYVRVNICRVALKFPPNITGIRAQRAFQTQTLARLKETKGGCREQEQRTLDGQEPDSGR